MSLLLRGHAGTQRMRLFQQQSFSQEQIFALGCFCVQNKVYAASDQLCHHQRRTANKSAEIKAVQQIFAHLKLFLKLWISNFGNVHIAISGLVTLGILLHSGFEGRRNANVIYNQAALFVLKHAVDTRDGLHQIVSVHWLVNIHRSQ